MKMSLSERELPYKFARSHLYLERAPGTYFKQLQCSVCVLVYVRVSEGTRDAFSL